MSEIIAKINRTRGLDYRIDRKGNVIESKYNWFRDKSTIIMIVILVLSTSYYVEISNSKTNAKNFDKYCTMYSQIKEEYIQANPNSEITLEKVIEYQKTKESVVNG